MRLFLLKRFPGKDEIIPVYAVGVTILFSWTIVLSIRDATDNWILFFSVSDILNLFAYIFAGALVESLLLMTALLFINFILPRKLFANRFVLRGTVLTISFLGSIIYIYSLTLTLGILAHINKWVLFFLISTLVLIVLSEMFVFVAKVFETIADRCIIFLYIYIPLALISIFVVFIRNTV